MKKQFSHGTPQQMLDIVNNKITQLQSQSVDSSTKISAATGSVDEMIDAVNGRINQLESEHSSVNSTEYIPSDKEELILPEDYETIYLDSQYTFGDGGELSLAQIKEYWNGNYDGDPSLAMYDSFDSWWEDTKRWLSPVSSSTSVDSVESASYFFDDEDNADGSNYIHTLIGYIQDKLNSKVENLSVEENEEELNIVVTIGGVVLEFTVPLADLTCKFETINEDVKYIVDAIKKDIDENENIKSSTAIRASEDSDRFIMLAHKSVPDIDGFNTDYTLYHDTEEDMYVCVFGDNDAYTPENSDYDWEGESIDEAYEWFDSYEGFVDEEY